MLVDCDGCAMRDVACMECSVGVLLGLSRPEQAATVRERRSPDPAGGPAAGSMNPAERPAVDADLVVEQWPGRTPFEWDATERRAIRALIDGGLIPPIRATSGSKSVTSGEISIAERGRLAG
jgi:hypothetical protein